MTNFERMLFSNHFWFWLDFFELMANGKCYGKSLDACFSFGNLGCEFSFE
jgi:hypothetical protein